ncbi:hypothetical protein G9A89_008414 [Geosiphon pyriformis]|nr:hypothetical protein G9A89_008414 [Geosiphon pyriformis]
MFTSRNQTKIFKKLFIPRYQRGCLFGIQLKFFQLKSSSYNTTKDSIALLEQENLSQIAQPNKSKVYFHKNIFSTSLKNTQNIAIVEDIKRELEDTKTEYRRCLEKLERLSELRKKLREDEYVDEKERKKFIEEKEEVEKQETKLELSKDRWELQIQKLQSALIETNQRVSPTKDLKLEMIESTSSFLDLLFSPFDETIKRSNLEQCLTSTLLCKLPVDPYYCKKHLDYLNYLEPSCSEPFYNVPRLSTIVSNIIGKPFTEYPGEEERTADGVNDHILDMITLANDYIKSIPLRWTRNRTLIDTNITTRKQIWPDITIYCDGLLVMMGEEKDVMENLDIAAEQLDS